MYDAIEEANPEVSWPGKRAETSGMLDQLRQPNSQNLAKHKLDS